MGNITFQEFAFLYGKELAERLNIVNDIREWSKKTKEELDEEMKSMIDEELRG